MVVESWQSDAHAASLCRPLLPVAKGDEGVLKQKSKMRLAHLVCALARPQPCGEPTEVLLASRLNLLYCARPNGARSPPKIVGTDVVSRGRAEKISRRVKKSCALVHNPENLQCSRTSREPKSLRKTTRSRRERGETCMVIECTKVKQTIARRKKIRYMNLQPKPPSTSLTASDSPSKALSTLPQ